MYTRGIATLKAK